MVYLILTLIITTLLSVAVLLSKINPYVKTVLIPLLIFSSITSVLILHEFLGHPVVKTAIASEITVYGQYVDKASEKIYILNSEKGELGQPHYVEYPYNESLHKALSSGKRKFKGEPFKIKGKEGDGKEGDGKDGDGEKGGGKGDKDGDGKGKGKNISLESSTFEAYRLPPPVMPDK